MGVGNLDKKTLETDTKENDSKKFLSGILVGGLFVLLIGFLYVRSSSNQLKLSGNVVTEERDVSNFNKVLIRGSGKVNLEQGDTESLSVTTDDKLIEYVKTYVSGDELVLEIDYPERFGFTSLLNVEVEYNLHVKDINKVTIDGSGELISTKLTSDEMEFVTSGSGNIQSELEVNKLISKISGSGTYDLTGMAEIQTISIEGSGKYKGESLEGKEGNILINGSGDTQINVSDKLSIEINGSGKVVYFGNPEIESTNISGSGSIEKSD